jgi:MraZ protein
MCLEVGESGDTLSARWGGPTTESTGLRSHGAEVGVFVGVHERQLDPKGRVALPAPFRPRLEPRCYLSVGRDKCVDILTADSFEEVARDAVEKVRRGEMDRNQQRALASNTFEVVVDAQGRILIDEVLRAYAGLSLNTKVVVTGSFDRVEIWEPGRHGSISAQALREIAGEGVARPDATA